MNDGMTENARSREQIISNEIQREIDLNHNFSQQKQLHFEEQLYSAGTDKFYHSKHNTPHQALPASTFISPGASPDYYDPLHIRNLEQNSSGVINSGFDVDFYRNDPYVYPLRGILKKNLSNSDRSLATSTEDSNSFNKAKSVQISQNAVKCNPVVIHPFNSDDSQSLPFSLQDPKRVSAFTPVASRKKTLQNSDQFNTESFTPVKAPAVLDCVSSSFDSSDQDVGSLSSAYLTHQSPYKFNRKETDQHQTKQVYSVNASPSKKVTNHHFTPQHHRSIPPHHHCTPPHHHSNPPQHHSSPSDYHSMPPSHCQILLHQGSSSHYKTTSSFCNSTPHQHSTVLHHHSTPLHQQSTYPHSRVQSDRPVPVPRKSARNLQQNFESLSMHSESASHASGSCSSGSPSSQVEALTNESVRLRHFLDTASATDLKRYLQNKLDSKNPTIIKALSKLIPVTVAKQIESHCVRCHKVDEVCLYLH